MSLQDYLDQFSSPLEALNNPLPTGPIFPYPQEHSNYRDEQRAWNTTAVLFNQSWHMTDLYISGPDAKKLLSDTSVNSYNNFGAGRAKQYLAVNHQGYVIGDAILFGLSDDLYSVVGGDTPINWLQYQAEVGDYDVDFSREQARIFAGEGSTPKRFFRYELEGPTRTTSLKKLRGKNSNASSSSRWQTLRSTAAKFKV